MCVEIPPILKYVGHGRTKNTGTLSCCYRLGMPLEGLFPVAVREKPASVFRSPYILANAFGPSLSVTVIACWRNF